MSNQCGRVSRLRASLAETQKTDVRLDETVVRRGRKGDKQSELVVEGRSVLKKIDVAPRCCREDQCCSAFFDDLAR